jgi:chaperonin GroES
MKNYTFRPEGNYISAEIIEEGEKTSKGGILLPDQARDKPQMAKILAVGPGTVGMLTGELEPIPLAPGDIVIVNKYSYQMIEMPNGDKVAFFSYGDVYGLIEEVPEVVLDGSE